MSYIQLPDGKVEKDNKTTKLTNFPRNHDVSVLFPKLCNLNDINDTEFQRFLVRTNKNREHLEPYLLASGKLGKSTHDDIYVVVTEGRLNDAQVRQMLDPAYEMYCESRILLKPFSKASLSSMCKIP